MCGLALITQIRPGISRRHWPEGRAVVVVQLFAASAASNSLPRISIITTFGLADVLT